MKYRDLTIDYIATLDEDTLRDTRYAIATVSTNVKKALKKIEKLPVETDRQAMTLAHARGQVARANALSEAIMCREDELFGPGVLSSYDHTERFV